MNTIKEPLRADSDGNVILRTPMSRKLPMLLLFSLSSVVVAASIWLMYAGGDSSMNTFRIAAGTIIALVSLFQLRKREIYVLTRNSLLLYGKWELPYRKIESVTVNSAFMYKELLLTSKEEEYTISQNCVPVKVEAVAEYIAQKIKSFEDKDKEKGADKR